MSDNVSAAYAGSQRILSGVQTSGALHLGNYLGALVKFVRLQHQAECFYFLADLHAITVWQDPALLPQQMREVAAAFIASGVDPAKAAIFPQSAVPEHAELAWIFNCVARLGWLDRMTQFKEKSGQHKERSSVGLYTYPVLQAADILVYKATHVPVGEDQKQHLELTRDIAQKFNNDFGAPGFPITEPVIDGPGARVMSLRDGSAKMSKSDPSDNSRINLLDTAETIAQKIRKAKTDPEPLPETLDELKLRPEADNLVGIYAALGGRTKAEVLAEFAGQGFGAFKPALADLTVARIGPIGEEMRRLLADPVEIDKVLQAGVEKARAVAGPVVAETKRLVGFWAPARMIRPVLIALLAAISLGAPAWAHEVKAGDLTLQHLAVRATFGGLPTSAGYVLIVNAGTRPDRLLSVSCDCAKAVQIHLSEMKGAAASMRQQAFVDIPAGGKVEFKPDGLHLMLVGLKAPLVDGTMQQMTLRFARAGTVKAGFHVKARIEAEGSAAAPAMGDMPAMAH